MPSAAKPGLLADWTRATRVARASIAGGDRPPDHSLRRLLAVAVLLLRSLRRRLLLLAGCRDAGRFDRTRMQAIVDAVRPRVTTSHTLYTFKLAPSLDPGTLGPAPAMLGRGDGRGLVRAEIDDARHLSVSIETVDHGHAGEAGFMYTDPGFAHADLEDVQRDSQHETRIDDRWPSWRYDLD